MRWLQPDGDRWIRPDAARFLAPGADIAKAFPVLARKYSPDQPRVPAGNPDGGQWTDDAAAGGISSGRLGRDVSIAEEVGSLGLFEIKPHDTTVSGARLAGDPPDKLPPIVVTPEEAESGLSSDQEASGPPEIPSRRPDTTDERMRFVRNAVRWIRIVGRYSPLADVFFGAADQIKDLNGLTAMIRSANDPPMTLDELQVRAQTPGESDYHTHHIVGQFEQNRRQFGNARIDSPENKVRIPIVKHLDINGYYSRPNEQYGDMSPRDYLRGKSWDEQMSVGLKILRENGVLK